MSITARRSARVDHELRALVARWRAAADATARFADELASADAGSVVVDLLRQAGAAGSAVVARMRADPDLAGRVDDLLDGDLTPDDIDAVIDWLQNGRGRGRHRRRAPHVRRRPREAARRGRCDGEPADPLGDAGSSLGLSRWTTAGAAYTLLADGRGLVDAFGNHRSGAHKASTITRTAFDGSSLACTVGPSVPTCGAAVVTGVVWGGAEVYEHREGIRQAADVTGQLARSKARDLRQAVERRLAEGGDQVGSLVQLLLEPRPTGMPLIPIAPGLGPVLEGMTDAGREHGPYRKPRGGRGPGVRRRPARGGGKGVH